MKTRRVSPDIYYKGVNITKAIEGDVKSFSYTDVASGAADTISLTIQDRNKKWLTSWAPEKGDSIKVKLRVENWERDETVDMFDCGTFIVDQPVYSGRPVTLILGAISMPNNNNFTTTEKSKTWDNATLKEIAQTLASNAGLELFFDSRINPTISFIEQSETSDKSFLFNLCERYGVVMKLYNQKIILFEEAFYEAKEATITIDENSMEQWNLTPSLTDTGYDGVSIDYFDPQLEEQYSYQFIIPGTKGDKILKITDIVYSLAEAELKAKGELRKANKNETKLNITVVGNTQVVASNTVNITGFGRYSGKYYIDQITRQLEPYRLTLDLHKVLEGY